MKLPYQNKIAVSAHQGNRAFFDANTLPAFCSAIEMGCDMIETDIHITADGELVLLHDHEFDGQPVHNYTYTELRQRHSGIVTLQELLELYQKHPKMLLNLELKDFLEHVGDLALLSAQKALARLEEYDMFPRTVVNTVSDGKGEINRWIFNTYGNRVRLHAYTQMFTPEGHPTTLLPTSYCCFVYGPKAPQTTIPAAKQAGLEAWTCYRDNRPQLVMDSIAAGANLILADDPQSVLEFLRSKGLHK